MTILINTISGFSASSRHSKDTIDGFVSKILDNEEEPLRFTHCSPIGFNKQIYTMDLKEELSIFSNTKGILLVGKSFGAIKLWDTLMTEWKTFDRFLENNKISVVLIDPHGAVIGDKKFGSYGTLFRKKMDINNIWMNDYIREREFHIKCFYQRNKYPKGARFKEKSLNYKLKDGTHWNITDINSRPGQIIRDYIYSEMDWLKGK